MIRRINHHIASNPRFITVILIGILLLPVVAHIYNSRFTRMMADDYCYAHDALTRGLWGALHYSYNNWSGTPSSTVGQSLVGLLGPRANALAPGLYMILLWFALVWAFLQLARLLRPQLPPIAAVLVASLSLYGIVAGIPNAYQSLYWTSGSVVYAAPLSLIFFHLGLLLYAIRKNLSGLSLTMIAFACGLLTFIIAGFTQTIAAMETAIFGLALLAGWRLWRRGEMRAAFVVVLYSLIGAALGVVVAVIAPGNAVRQALHPSTLPMVEVGLLALQNTAAFFAIQLSRFSFIPALTCLFLSAIAANQLQPHLLKLRLQFKTTLKWMGVSAAVGFILVMAFLAPAAYGMGKMPAARAWVVPQTILILVALSWGMAMGLSIAKRGAAINLSWRAAAIVIVLLIVGPIVSAINTFSDTAVLHTYASEWDNQDQAIRAAVAAGNRDFTLHPYSVDMADFANLDAVDETETGALCLQRYYGLEAVQIAAETGNDT